MTNIVQHINEERPEALLLLAWNLYSKKDAVKCVLINLDANGFVLDILHSKETPKETVIYEFPKGPIKDSKTMVKTFGDLLTRHSGGFNWPPTIAQYVLIVAYIIILTAAASDVDLQRYPILVNLQPYALMIFRKPIYAINFLIICIVAHTLEALYVGYLCSMMTIPKNSIVSWVSMTLIFGAPTTLKILSLSKVAKKRKMRFD